MAFGEDDLVEITYQANVQGMDEVEALRAQNAELQAQVDTYGKKLVQGKAAQDAHTQSVVSAGRELNQLRRAFIGLLLPITADVAILNEMAKGSETIAKSLEDSGAAFATWAGQVGNSIAFAARVYGAMSTGMSMTNASRLAQKDMDENISMKTTIARMSLEEKTAKLQGDDLLALQIKQDSEKIQLKEKYHGDAYNILKKALDREQAAETEAFHLSELGLKNHLTIQKDFQKNLVTGAQGETSNVIENFLTGTKQTPGDIAAGFVKTFAHTIAEAMSQSLFTSFASGGNFFTNFKNILTGRTPQVIAAERAARASEDISSLNNQMLSVLNQIAECVCSTAKSINGMSYTPPKVGTAGKISAVAGLVGALAGAGALGAGGIGGGGATAPQGPSAPPTGYAPGYSAANPPNIGYDLPKFPSGGEVQISAMPGEFVVRRAAAMENKDVLQSMNAGGGMTPKGGNVFLIKANDAQSFVDALGSPSSRNAIEIQIIRSIMSNGSVRNIIKSFAN